MPRETNRKVAMITGISGQDGSYLAELLLSKGYSVHGLIRHSSSNNTGRISHLHNHPKVLSQEADFNLHFGDLADSACLIKIIRSILPTEIYNLTAQSQVSVSFALAEYTADVDALGTLRLLDAIRTCGLENSIRMFQAGTSEMFGKAEDNPQKETTPFHPRSPYGVAKVYGFWIVINYRESYDMYACNGIMYNHESTRRGESFVTRKITQSVAKIHLGLQSSMELGNIDCERDWGHARDYVEAMWLMLQQDNADDFVIATGKTTSVRKFIEEAFKIVNVDIEWEGSGLDEVGKDKATGIIRVKINPAFYQPVETHLLVGDASKAKEKLNWEAKTTVTDLIKEMVENDIELLKKYPTA